MDPAELDRQNRTLSRRLRRLEDNVRQMEVLQDANAKLLSGVMRELETEKARSHELLLNVLPQPIIDRLEAGETVIADRYESVSVLFSDIVGFTAVAASLPAPTLVEELGALIAAFDDVCGRTGVEKIKTIGDAYLAVGGLQGSGEDHAAAVADTALAMLAAVGDLGRRRMAWRLRIGLHIGPCVAGVIGTRKFAYDVWGDTINVASRLQTSSEAGRIHVSSAMAAALDGRYRLEPRGEVELKGVGRTETFFLLGAAG